jgi:hypothetical protein
VLFDEALQHGDGLAVLLGGELADRHAAEVTEDLEVVEDRLRVEGFDVGRW